MSYLLVFYHIQYGHGLIKHWHFMWSIIIWIHIYFFDYDRNFWHTKVFVWWHYLFVCLHTMGKIYIVVNQDAPRIRLKALNLRFRASRKEKMKARRVSQKRALRCFTHWEILERIIKKFKIVNFYSTLSNIGKAGSNLYKLPHDLSNLLVRVR